MVWNETEATLRLLESPLIGKLVDLALQEDLGQGDPTSKLCLDAQHRSRAFIIAKESFTVCGLPLLEVIARRAKSRIKIEIIVKEGSKVKAGRPLAKISGPTREILACERTMLNFLQRLSAISTQTSRIVDCARGLTVLDTRKTTPGWRLLEKYAVRVGGGANHRLSLGDMLLIKNNHVDAQRGADRAQRMRTALRGIIFFYVSVIKKCDFV